MAGLVPAGVVDDPADRLAHLFDSHYERLYRLARRLAPSADDALDLVQETFLRATRSPKSIPAGARDEEAWLVRVLVNIRRDEWRKKSVRERHGQAALGRTRLEEDQEASLIARRVVWQALDALDPRRRAIVVMHELEGLGIPEIAALLGITAITVRWHLSVGRRELTLALKSRIGGIHEGH